MRFLEKKIAKNISIWSKIEMHKLIYIFKVLGGSLVLLDKQSTVNWLRLRLFIFNKIELKIN